MSVWTDRYIVSLALKFILKLKNPCGLIGRYWGLLKSRSKIQIFKIHISVASKKPISR